jgi:hypothetical protein
MWAVLESCDGSGWDVISFSNYFKIFVHFNRIIFRMRFQNGAQFVHHSLSDSVIRQLAINSGHLVAGCVSTSASAGKSLSLQAMGKIFS